jgi:hypothetical protein
MKKPKSATQKPEGLAALEQIASILGIDLKNPNVAIATTTKTASARSYNGLLEARVYGGAIAGSSATIYTQEGMGIMFDKIDHVKQPGAPAEAIYAIQAFRPEGTCDHILNGDTGVIYLGREGLILNNGLKRALDKRFER